MDARHKQLKAQDVFNRTDFALGKASSFSEAFPSVESIRVSVVEEGEGMRESSSARTYTERQLGEYINCSNPRCYNGGVRIAEVIRFMMADRKTEEKKSFPCQGYEGSPKGRKRYGPCDHYFTLSISIVMRHKS